MEKTKERNVALDFLRGIAILLVLLRHQTLTEFTTRMGWIGVDLFFVLSGFLVSGLLFKEYIKKGTISPARFLIRRGFKIYPLYYGLYVLYVLNILAARGKIHPVGILADLSFTQNYIWGWGYAYDASWSLAVEEHFYFALCIGLWLILKYRKSTSGWGHDSFIPLFVAIVLLTCLGLRIYSNLVSGTTPPGNFTMTHLRIDSLMLGVGVSYFYYFRCEEFTTFLHNNRVVLLSIAVCCLVWTPFIEPVGSFFVQTIGFSLTAIAFAIVLCYTVIAPSDKSAFKKAHTYASIRFMARIGFGSYATYLIHSLVIYQFDKVKIQFTTLGLSWFHFLLCTTTCVALGMIITYTAERYILRLRDRLYPANA